MELRPLGSTGVSVSPLCLGAMMFGAWGNDDEADSIRIIHRALDAGINFVDTADVYSRGGSEEIVGKALEGGRRDNVVLATKVHGTMGDDPNEFGNSRRWIVREVENSLRRLRTDWIDLYQIHRPEPDTDIDETLGALTDLVRAGKVRYIGSSTFPASAIVEAQWVAQRRGRERFVLRATAVLPARPRRRGRRAAHLRALWHGRDPLESARRRLALGALAQGRRRPHVPPRRDAPPALRPVDSRQPTQARCRRRTRPARRGGRAVAHPPRPGLGDPPSGGDRGDHRPAHDRASGVPAGRRRRARSPTTCSTASTRSSRRASTSTRPISAGPTRR